MENGTITDQQWMELLKPLDKSRVEHNENGNAYLAQWDVRRQLNRIFGFGGYDITVLSKERTVDSRGQEFCYVVYEATVRLIVKDHQGRRIAHWDDVAAGEATGYRSPKPKQLSLGQAYHTALTTAVSTALRRCATNLGDQMGLSLYNDGSTDPVVSTTLLDSLKGIPSPREVEDEILAQHDEEQRDEYNEWGEGPDDAPWKK